MIVAGDFDVNGDGAAEHVTPGEFGTAHITTFRMIDKRGVNHELDTPVNEDGGGYVGRWYVASGRGHLITFADEDEKYISGLFEVTKDHEFRLLCAFTNRVQRMFSPHRPEDKAICDTADADLPPDPEKRAMRPDTKGWPYANDKSIGPSLPISFDNAGTKTGIAQTVVDFGGGRGCDYDYFELAGDAGTPAGRRQRELLAALQERDDYSRPMVGCPNTRFSWFSFKAMTFLRSRPASVRVSGAFDDADRVNGVVDGVPRRICGAAFLVTWTLTPP